MNTLDDTFSVTDLRHKTSKILDRVADKGIVYLVRHSKTEAALVDMEYLVALQQAYENYIDTLEFDETVTLKRIPLSKHKKAPGKKS